MHFKYINVLKPNKDLLAISKIQEKSLNKIQPLFVIFKKILSKIKIEE